MNTHHTNDTMAGFKLARPIGRKSFFQRAEVLDEDGNAVGAVQASHEGSGWKGYRSDYVFTPNEAGRNRGLKRAEADTQRQLLADLGRQHATHMQPIDGVKEGNHGR